MVSVKRVGRWSKVAAGAMLLVLSVALTTPVVEASPRSAARLRLGAELVCLAGGGANVTLTFSNEGSDFITLDGDFHLFLDAVTSGGREFAGAVFVFPAPGFDTVASGGEVTFQVPIGDAVEGEPGSNLNTRRLLLEAEVFLEGQDRPIVGQFSFPGCDA